MPLRKGGASVESEVTISRHQSIRSMLPHRYNSCFGSPVHALLVKSGRSIHTGNSYLEGNVPIKIQVFVIVHISAIYQPFSVLFLSARAREHGALFGLLYVSQASDYVSFYRTASKRVCVILQNQLFGRSAAKRAESRTCSTGRIGGTQRSS